MEPFSPLVPPESGSGSKMPQNVFKYGAEPKKTKQSEQVEPVIFNFNDGPRQNKFGKGQKHQGAGGFQTRKYSQDPMSHSYLQLQQSEHSYG
jgi:hypothetical protein|tara:strand:- start:1254 stop:1529 length:276 start_codon:yes stop_codon:yes gene_type:complete